jgi:hypothetical protein
MQAQDRGRRGALGSAPCCAHGRLLSRRIPVLVSVRGCLGCRTRATTYETWRALRRECCCARAHLIAHLTAQHTFTLKRKTKSSSTAALVREMERARNLPPSGQSLASTRKPRHRAFTNNPTWRAPLSYTRHDECSACPAPARSRVPESSVSPTLVPGVRSFARPCSVPPTSARDALEQTIQECSPQRDCEIERGRCRARTRKSETRQRMHA